MKIELQKVAETMLENKIPQETIDEVIAQLEAAAELEAAQVEEDKPQEQVDDAGAGAVMADDKPPRIKWESVIILHDKNGLLKDKEIAGWVVNQEENSDAGLILSKLKDSALDQNEAAKKKKNRITSWEDLFDSLKSKWIKSKRLKIKTKDLTRVIICDGKF